MRRTGSRSPTTGWSASTREARLSESAAPRAPLDRLPENEIEALEQRRNALGIHFQAISSTQLTQSLQIGRGGATHIAELGEVALEPCRRDDLEDPRRLVARIPEGVPLIAGLEDEVAG